MEKLSQVELPFPSFLRREFNFVVNFLRTIGKPVCDKVHDEVHDEVLRELKLRYGGMFSGSFTEV
jgi:hypothetical protein